MEHDTLVVVFGVLTALLALGYGLPQWLKIRRTGSVAGVSVASMSCALVSAIGWVAYGVWLRDIWVVLTSLAAIPGLVAALVVLLRTHASRDGLALPVGWAAALALSGAVVPWTTVPVTLLLGGSILWYAAPAAWTAWRSPDVTGVASGAWWLLLAEAVVCTAYGLVADVPAYLVYAALAGVGALVVLARFAWRWTPDCGRCAPLTRCSCEPALV